MRASASSCSSSSRASATVTRIRLLRPKKPGIISFRLIPTSSIPCGPIISRLGPERSSTSISTGRSSRLPLRSRSRSFSRVADGSSATGAEVVTAPGAGVGGRRRASSRSSARAAAFGRTATRRSSRTIATAISIRSRTIASQSRPT